MQRKHYAKVRTRPDGSRLRVGVVVSEFNEDITMNMLAGALEELRACGVAAKNVEVVRVPGSFEVPYGCLTLINKKIGGKKFDAIVALGCVIKGETTHDFYIASAVSKALMDLALENRVPIAFGIITTNNLAQAKARSTGRANKGNEAAITAIRMALLK